MKKVFVPMALVASSSAFALGGTHDVTIGLTLTAGCEIVDNATTGDTSTTVLDLGTHAVNATAGSAALATSTTGSANTSHVGGNTGGVGGTLPALFITCSDTDGFELSADWGDNAVASPRKMQNTAITGAGTTIDYNLICGGLSAVTGSLPAGLPTSGAGIDLSCTSGFTPTGGGGVFSVSTPVSALVAPLTSVTPIPMPIEAALDPTGDLAYPSGDYQDVVTFTLTAL